MITRIIEITHITTKQDLSRWTRAHADVPGITWSVFPGPGGTMIIVKHAEDRSCLNSANFSPDVASSLAGPAGSADIVRLSA